MNTIADIIAVFALCVALAFPATYAARSPWRAMRVGRSMMYLSISLAVLLLLNVGSIWFPDYPGRPLARLITYSVLALSLLGQLRTLVKVQNRKPGYNSELHTEHTKEKL